MVAPLLSTAYLPPVEYISIIARHGMAQIEAHEHFVKQTYRNRAVILGANGPLSLIIPLKKGKNNKQLITETEIDYSTSWQTAHWRAIVSSYGGSPYFEFYADYFQLFYTKQYNLLFEYNLELTRLLLKLLKINNQLVTSNSFTGVNTIDNDYRYSISPKFESPYSAKKYRQVFSDKFGFVPNLSSLDLLFCMGNRSDEIFKS